MYKSIIYIVFIALLTTACGQRGHQEAEKIMVFAGASLNNVMTELADSFQLKYKTQVVLNFASSGTLARQMEQGSIPDIYISASTRWAKYVCELALVDAENQKPIAQNQLMLIAPLNSTIQSIKLDSSVMFSKLLADGKLSMGDPAHVPAGKYAKQAMEYYGWYTSIQKQILRAKDVRSALMFVELGEAPLGIVYRSDAIRSKKVKVLDTFNPSSHEPIQFVASLCQEKENARLFYQFITSQEMEPIWMKYGFKQ